MREKINKLARGLVDFETPRLRLSNTSFAGELAAGERKQFELLLISENGVQLKGLAYSSHPKVRILKEAFGGMRTKLGFEVDSRDAGDGDVISGNLDLVSNAGEQKIPFEFIVTERPEEEEAEPIAEKKTTAADTETMSVAPMATEEAPHPGIADLEEVLADPVQVEKLAAELLKSDEKNPDAYLVYLQAVRNNSKLNRLYEALLAALPAAYEERLPREVYLYFAYAQDTEPALRETLYFNVLKNFDKDDDIYLAFERRIQEYAIQTLLQGTSSMGIVNDCLALIYDRMIYPEMIDRRIAEVFPAVLNSYKIQCDARYTAIAVHYDCFKRDSWYPLTDGVAYVPLYMPGFTLSFRDAEGQESTEVSYRCTRMLDKPALEQRCFEIAPDQPMLKLRHAAEYAKRGIQNQDELEKTEDAIASLDLSRAYRTELNNAILAYYEAHCAEDARHPFVGEISYLRSIRARRLDEKNRGVLAETMIAFGEYTEAYNIILRYGVQTLKRESLEQLLVYMIGRAQSQETQPEKLVLLSFRAFQEGTENGRILSYLLQNFSGMSLDMQDILDRALKLQRQQAMEAAQRREAVEAEMEAKEQAMREEAEARRVRSASVRQQLREESSRISNTQKALERILNRKREDDARDEASENRNGAEESLAALNDWQQPACMDGEGEASALATDMALTEIREKAEAEEARRRDDYIRDQDILSMAERLMAQMLFTRESRGLDEVYDIYLLHDGHDFMLIRAYMTTRAQDYFLQQLSVRDSFFRDLYTLVHSEKNKERLPLIYLLALTKYMSILRELAGEECEELNSMMQVLLKKKLIFAYTKKLQRFITLPDYITDKTYIEYHGDREDKPTLYVRILPDETAYHAEEISRVYQNIFVAPLTLFAGERADFQIRPMDPEKPVLKGCVEAGAPRKSHGDTYDMLNEMSAVAEKGKDETLRDLMLRYAENEATIGILFADADRNRKGEQAK